MLSQQSREESVFSTDNSFGDKGFLTTEECNTLVNFAQVNTRCVFYYIVNSILR